MKFIAKLLVLNVFYGWNMPRYLMHHDALVKFAEPPLNTNQNAFQQVIRCLIHSESLGFVYNGTYSAPPTASVKAD